MNAYATDIILNSYFCTTTYLVAAVLAQWLLTWTWYIPYGESRGHYYSCYGPKAFFYLRRAISPAE